MNKQELINHIEEVKGDKPHYREQYHLGRWQAIEGVLELIDQLNETEITEEQAWEVIGGYNEMTAKEANQTFADGMVEKQTTTQLVEIPHFVAETIEKYKENDNSLGELLSSVEHANIKYYHGMEKHRVNFNIFFEPVVDLCATIARAWLDGYTIETPKTLQVIVKNYDSTVYKTELPEDEAMKLIERWKG